MSDQFVLIWRNFGAGGYEHIDFGIPTACSTTFSKSVSKFPIVTQSYDDTFALDSKTSKSYNFSFVRKNGDDGMSNPEWLEVLDEAMDRWQVDSDGFTVRFNRDNWGRAIYPGFPSIETNGYVRSVSVKYKSGLAETLYGTVSISVGKMRVSNARRA